MKPVTWIPTSRKMPPVAVRVFVMVNGMAMTGQWGGGNVWSIGTSTTDNKSVTHWMPIPTIEEGSNE